MNNKNKALLVLLPALFLFALQRTYCKEEKDNSINIEFNYMIAGKENYIDKSNKPIGDIGFRVNMLEYKDFHLGLSGNFSILKSRFNETFISTYIVKPRLNFEYYKYKSKIPVSPTFGMGYALIVFPELTDVAGADNTRHGAFISAGLKFNPLRNIFLQGSFDRYKLRAENYGRESKIFYWNIGLGFRF